eukprot:5449628-Pyramimonas_sp.AAC.1
MLRRRAFRQSHIQDIVEPPKELAGRGGAVRLKSPTFDILVIVAYYPPSQKHQVDHWTSTCAQLTAWLH